MAAIVAGMVAGADSIDDLDLLRHGGMGRLFDMLATADGVRAPSTLGTFLRSFTFGHVRQLDAVAAWFTAALATHTPLLPGAGQVAFVDVEDTVKRTYGHAKEGAGYGYSKVKGLNALVATVSSPLAAPVIVATRLRKGSTSSARGTARLVADALTGARPTTPTATTGAPSGTAGDRPGRRATPKPKTKPSKINKHQAITRPMDPGSAAAARLLRRTYGSFAI